MLRLRFRSATKLTCPHHKRETYKDPQRFSRCDVCQALYDLQAANDAVDRAQRKAEQWISRAAVTIHARESHS